MVFLAFEDGESAIELFCEKETDHLVGESHGGERQLVVGCSVDRWSESEGAADYEGQGAGAGIHGFLQILSKGF